MRRCSPPPAATNTESYFERFDALDGLPPLATLGEYTDLYGALSAARAATARALLKRASQLIRDSYPGIDDRIAVGAVPGRLGRAGRAEHDRPGDAQPERAAVSETTGPFSRAYDPDAASGMLQITAAETGCCCRSSRGAPKARSARCG
jgi:hypothetical protein